MPKIYLIICQKYGLISIGVNKLALIKRIIFSRISQEHHNRQHNQNTQTNQGSKGYVLISNHGNYIPLQSLASTVRVEPTTRIYLHAPAVFLTWKHVPLDELSPPKRTLTVAVLNPPNSAVYTELEEATLDPTTRFLETKAFDADAVPIASNVPATEAVPSKNALLSTSNAPVIRRSLAASTKVE